MYANLVETVEHSKTGTGQGCILAHCMGLGKTIQTLALLQAVLVNQELDWCKKILVSFVNSGLKIHVLSRFMTKFVSKSEFFVQNRNYCQKVKFLSKIQIYVKNQDLCQKVIFLSKIQICVKNQNLCQKVIFFFSKIEICVKNRNLCQKANLFCQKSKFVGLKFVLIHVLSRFYVQ